MPNLVKVIGFDWGGVIAGVSSVEFNTHVTNILGVSVDEYNSAYFRYNNLASRGEMWRAMISDLGSDEKLIDEILEYCDNKNDTPDSKMIDTLTNLKQAGYKLGLLTNANAEVEIPRREQLQKHNLEQLYDVIDISYETGLRKPSLEAYEHFYSQFGDVSPKKIIFIDDVERNLEIPRRLGWHTIFLNHPINLARDLVRLSKHK